MSKQNTAHRQALYQELKINLNLADTIQKKSNLQQ